MEDDLFRKPASTFRDHALAGLRFPERDLRGFQRQPHHHRRADTEYRTNTHSSTVQLGEGLCDRQSKSGALMPLRQLTFHLLERAAEFAQGVLGDADAVVRDCDGDQAAAQRQAEHDGGDGARVDPFASADTA